MQASTNKLSYFSVSLFQNSLWSALEWIRGIISSAALTKIFTCRFFLKERLSCRTFTHICTVLHRYFNSGELYIVVLNLWADRLSLFKDGSMLMQIWSQSVYGHQLQTNKPHTHTHTAKNWYAGMHTEWRDVDRYWSYGSGFTRHGGIWDEPWSYLDHKRTANVQTNAVSRCLLQLKTKPPLLCCHKSRNCCDAELLQN